MPLDQAARASFSRRFNPVDLSNLTQLDAENLRHWLLTGRILEYLEVDTKLRQALRGVWVYRCVETSRRHSWSNRIAALELAANDEPFWFIVSISESRTHVIVPLMEARAARHTAIRAHELLDMHGRQSYGQLRRDRKEAWRTFTHLTLPAFRAGLDEYLRIVLDATGRPR